MSNLFDTVYSYMYVRDVDHTGFIRVCGIIIAPDITTAARRETWPDVLGIILYARQNIISLIKYMYNILYSG